MITIGALFLLCLSILWPGGMQQLHPLMHAGMPAIAIATNTTTDDTLGNNQTQQPDQQKQISSSSSDTGAPSSSAGLRIAYPTGWMPIDLGNGTVTFSSPFKDDLMRFTVNVANIPPAMQQNVTLDTLVDLNLNGLQQQLANFELVESNQTTISQENQTAHKIVYTNTNKNPSFPLNFTSMQIFSVEDGQAYTISYVSEESRYERLLPIIEGMIDSISFINR